jgi:hypothetical protein
MKGFAFYIFLFAILVWCEVIAFRLNATRKSAGPED